MNDGTAIAVAGGALVAAAFVAQRTTAPAGRRAYGGPVVEERSPEKYRELVSALERGAGYRIQPDNAIALAGTVNREWGSSGYSMRIVGDSSGGGYALVHHSDGSEFVLHSDRWANVTLVNPEGRARGGRVRRRR